MRRALARNAFQVIPPKAWDVLQSWYDGGPPIERRVINYHGRLQLEMYPLSLKVRRRGVRGESSGGGSPSRELSRGGHVVIGPGELLGVRRPPAWHGSARPAPMESVFLV